MKNVQDTFTINNGIKIPCVGFGTWKIPDGDEAITAVQEALKAGYRHIDTAAAYRNEESVGKAIKNCGIPREELFITSKLRNADQGYDLTVNAFENTMKLLGLDYIDMYMIHWPVPKPHADDWQQTIPETWKLFEEKYKEGKIKALGVCNFLPHHLEVLLEKADIKPMVNQIEIHPGLLQEKAVAFSRKHGLLVEGWGPLSNGKIFASEELKNIAQGYSRSVAQICLRWMLQKDILPLPKSTTPSRIKENSEIFDFVISDADMKAIDELTGIEDSGMYPDSIWF